ncbi:MAG: NAD(P)H-hydrate epimerase, partial [Mobilicoccus sp.]|nr:NAD(P)H-hydrate epimerase [Mobilicoccus sp.]
MIRAYTAQQVREAEQPLLADGVPLMQRASAALAHRTARLLRERTGGVSGRRVLLLVGPGSNGGDALFAGAVLRRRGVAVRALQLHEGIHADGAAALCAAGGTLRRLDDTSPMTVEAVAAATDGVPDVVLDGILGIGGRAELGADLRTVTETVRAWASPVIAVDLPSGLDATTGEAAPGVLAADETVTFGAVKTGLLLPGTPGTDGGADLAGQIHCVDIGLGTQLPARAPVCRLTDEDVRARWPVPTRHDHKYSRGVVAVLAGSETYPGAAVL